MIGDTEELLADFEGLQMIPGEWRLSGISVGRLNGQ